MKTELVPLSHFCDIIKGLSYKGMYLNQDGPALLGIGTIKEGGGFRPENVRTYGGPYKQENILLPGDIYIALTSQDGFLIGSPAMVPLEFDGFGITTHHDAKVSWKIDDQMKKDFLFHLMHSHDFIAHCINFSIGTTVYSTSPKDVEAFLVPKELDDRQIKMTSILNQIHELENLIQKSLDLIKQSIRSIYRYKVLNFNVDTDSKFDAESLQIPDGWEYMEMRYVLAKFTTGLNPRKNFKLGEGENNYITTKNVKDWEIIINKNTDKVTDEALVKINRRSRLSMGDILLTGVGSIGDISFVHSEPKDWDINESVYSLRADTDILSNELLFCALDSYEFKDYCKRNALGSVQLGIRKKDIEKFRILTPPKETMLEITSIIRPYISKYYHLKGITSSLSEVKLSLRNNLIIN